MEEGERKSENGRIRMEDGKGRGRKEEGEREDRMYKEKKQEISEIWGN